MSHRHLILCAAVALFASHTAQAATVADLIARPTWDLSAQLAAEGNVHTADLIAAFPAHDDDDLKAVLLQTLILIAEPSRERTTFLSSSALDPSLDPALRLWMKVGLACDAPDDRSVMEQLLADEHIANAAAWSVINAQALEFRSTDLQELILNRVIDHIISLLKAQSPLITRHSMFLVEDFMTTLGERAGPDLLLQQRIETLAGDAALSALATDMGGLSIATILAAFAGAHESALPARTNGLLTAYFLADDILSGSADETDDSWASRRYRLLVFSGDLLSTLYQKKRPSYQPVVEASIGPLFNSDIPEARASAARHITYLPDPLLVLESLVTTGTPEAVAQAADVLRSLGLEAADTGRDIFKNILAHLERFTFDVGIPAVPRLSSALALIHFGNDRSDDARVLIRGGLWANDDGLRANALWNFAQLPTYNADDAKGVATILFNHQDDEFLTSLIDTLYDALTVPAKRTAWLEERAISNALLVLTRRPGAVGDAAERALRLYLDLLR